MNKIKKYLVPLSTLISAMPLASMNNQIDSSFYNKSSDIDEKLPNLSSLNSLAIGKLFEYSRGDELHSLIVKPNESGVMLSYHRSHRSHSSHRSHYSRR